jgi:glycosyltransferase involved in cell wall biosynthesis
MKILQVTPAFVPSKFGGVKVVSYTLSRALAKKGHEVTVYTTDADIGYSRLRYVKNTQNMNGFNIRYFKNVSNWFAFKYRLFLPMGLISTIKKEIDRFDIIHLHDFRSFHNIIVHHYATKYSIPYVLDAHGSTPRTSVKGKIKWLLRWLFDVTFGYKILRDASRCIGETEMGVNEYKELGINQDKIVLITPPFPVEEFSQLPLSGVFRRKYNIKEKHIILFLGRIHRIKGIDFLVESFYELTKDKDDIILAIVGPDDGYKSTLEGLIDKLNLTDKVLFTGFLDGDDKLSALVDVDMLVQTSRYEQGAWAPFEAILCNTPIIVSSNSGAGEDVRRVDAGYLVEWGNKKELQDAMQKILDDPMEAMNKTQKAKDYIIKNLSMEKNVEKYEKVYIDCIKEKNEEV